MRNRVPTSQREVDRLCRRIWNDAVRGRCMMQGIKTPEGRSPTYCGPGHRCSARIASNRTLPKGTLHVMILVRTKRGINLQDVTYRHAYPL